MRSAAPPFEPAGSTRFHEGIRIEIVLTDLGRQVRSERRGVEPRDNAHRGLTAQHARPQAVYAAANRRQCADASDDDTLTGDGYRQARSSA